MCKFLKRIGIPVLFAMVLLVGCGKKASAEFPMQETIPTETVQAHQLKEGIQTILVACLDTYEIPQGASGYRNGSRADFLMLLILDDNAGKITALQLNPDTVVPATIQGVTEPEQMPLGLVYSYGSGGSDSQLLGTKAVSNLLGGVPINHYLIFSADAITMVNDMVGGTTVEVADTFPQEYEELQVGETVTLLGENAKAYFCFRDGSDLSNDAHMERQNQFISKIYGPFLKNAQQEEFLTKLTFGLGDGMSTDLTLSQMLQMLELLDSYELQEEVMKLPGTVEKANGQNEFYVNHEAVERIVDQCFYVQ